ncbi:MAG TPA: type II toxin-antitoxin system RelE/ParE family toxin [Pirellulales bacterium]|nr:type II toxin-antitoxin system RelE/ParE family toxin [Pirellulales bacterium]
MSPKSSKKLSVIYAWSALRELDIIWEWNEKTYSRRHAADYMAFLEEHINALGRRYEHGKTLNLRADLRYIVIRRKAKGHGHIAVYRYDDKEVNVLHVFHTAQNWPVTLTAEQPSE